MPLPRPWLEFPPLVSSRGSFGDQIRPLALNEWGEVAFILANQGNAPAFNCVVELYESVWAAYHVLFTDMQLTGREFIVLQPGERREVVLPWRATRQVGGHIICRCYDPVLDPGNLTYEQYHRQNAGVGWQNWGG